MQTNEKVTCGCRPDGAVLEVIEKGVVVVPFQSFTDSDVGLILQSALAVDDDLKDVLRIVRYCRDALDHVGPVGKSPFKGPDTTACSQFLPSPIIGTIVHVLVQDCVDISLEIVRDAVKDGASFHVGPLVGNR